MQKKFLPDNWQVNIEGISVWSYFRFDHNDLPMSKYSPNYKLSVQDIIFFFKFIFLRMNKVDTVYFIAARNELLSLADQNDIDAESNSLVFLREDGHGIKGNVLFLEAFRYLFRKLAPFIFKTKYNSVKEQLISLQLNIEKLEKNINASVGDYYFNKFIRFFLKGKTIYFSNCVIPKIERTQALHQSVELQHGVIHDSHPDYANLIKGVFNIPLMCWGDFWENKIINAGFEGKLIIGSIPNKVPNPLQLNDNIGFFTTIDENISNSIMESLSQLDNYSIFVQPHPRDPFLYDVGKYKNVLISRGKSPVDCRIPILNDSTLIYFCVCNNKPFIYLASVNENELVIETKLANKYGAVLNRHYKIANNVKQLLNYVKV